MRGRLLALVVSTLLISVPASAQTASYEASVRALAHARYTEREKAARDLEAAGEPALPAVRAALANPDEEVRARAAAVVARIERAVRSQRLLTAPRLALKLDRVPLGKAVHEVAQKTGLSFHLEPGKGIDLNRPVTLDTGEVPFWQAVQAFYEAAGLTEADEPAPSPPVTHFESSGRQVTIRLPGKTALPGNRPRLKEGPEIGPAATGHALRVRAVTPDFAANKFDAETSETTIHLAVDPAPSLTVLELIGVEVRRARTTEGLALRPVYPPSPAGAGLGVAELVGARQLMILNEELNGLAESPYFPVRLRTDGQRPRRLAELEGVVVARVLAPPEPLVRVVDVFGKGKGKVHSADGLSCQVTAADEVSEQPLPPPRVRGGFGDPLPARDAAPAEAPAAIRVRLVTTADTASEVLNIPVQVRGRLRPFVRINRRSRPVAGNLPQVELRDSSGKAVRVLSSWVAASSFDGSNLTQELHVTFAKPAAGLDGLNLTLTGRRPVVVEMPFVLKDVPLP